VIRVDTTRPGRETMPDKARPRSFKEVVAAEDPAERARRENGETFEARLASVEATSLALRRDGKK